MACGAGVVLAGVGHHRIDFTAKHIDHANIFHVAEHIFVQRWLFSDEYRRAVFADCVANDRGHDTALTNAGLVANDETCAVLDVVDCQRNGVNLLCAKGVEQRIIAIPKLLANVCVNIAHAAAQCVQCVIDS